MGTVYLATDELGGGRVALKVLRTERLDSEGLVGLQREFRAIAGLSHPQIAGRTIPGTDRSGPQAFLKPILDLLDALYALHTQNVLHLDVHAGNLIDADDADRGAVLIDVGMHQPVVGPEPVVDTGSARWHFPPELARGETPTVATDIYAAGRLLLYRLTGLQDSVAKLPREFPGWGARTTIELERIIAKSVHPEPQHRFHSALEFRDAVRPAVGDRGHRQAFPSQREMTVGRDAELGTIESTLAECTRGKAAVVWITGPAGIGKSRLLTEARWLAQLRGLKTVACRFLPEVVAAPELQRLLRLVEKQHSDTTADWLSALAKEHGGSTRERARRASESYFASEPESAPPLVLLLDDFEYADRESRILAEELCRECARRAERLGPSRDVDPSRGIVLVLATSASPSRDLRPESAQLIRLAPLDTRTATAVFDDLLRSLHAPDGFLRRCVREARGSPLSLRQLAQSLIDRFGNRGEIPPDAEIPIWEISTAEEDNVGDLSAVELDVLRSLAVLGRASDRVELVAASARPPAEVARALKRLARIELVSSSRHGKVRLFYVTNPTSARALAQQESKKRRRQIETACIDALEALKRPDLRQLESLCRHFVAVGRRAEARELVAELTARLCQRGLLSCAIRLLEATLDGEKSGAWRLRLAERLSELHDLNGDHDDGISALEPVFEDQKRRFSGEQAVRVRRRLGVHHHRAGNARQAVELFEEALAYADPEVHRKELVFIHSELAELHTFRGEYEEAEAACREGLRLLEADGGSTPAEFHGSMEVTLRVTLGHLELRRMRLEPARQEFEAAVGLIRSGSNTSVRALRPVVLNNLGIVYNRLNKFAESEQSFRAAERQLSAAGERSALIHIACNLAVIAAKQGRESDLDAEIRKATRLLREHPGERLESFVETSKAVSHQLVGMMDRAVESFGKALPLGRRLGDQYMVRFSEVYLAEAHLACANYAEAAHLLNRVLSRRGDSAGPMIVRRMAAARLLFLGQLVGRRRLATKARRALADTPRTEIELLEAWNDFFLAAAAASEGVTDAGTFERSLEVFERLGVPAGARFARLGQLWCALLEKAADRVRRIVADVERNSGATSHRILALLEPLAAAESSYFLGDIDRATQNADRAVVGMVGQPFLELEWRLEFLRARIAERRGDRKAARHHLHRATQTRDFFVRALPGDWRDDFLALPRVVALETARSRLERRPATAPHRREPGDTVGSSVGPW